MIALGIVFVILCVALWIGVILAKRKYKNTKKKGADEIYPLW
ncbi:MAG: hypothetical protein BWY74_03646 [Firmicutes bacterium ADurb.Bin419]|nr:MAG: hypothetical protein BWY74_03646 [Firmicutes bacterium ADurb.Bin419]